MPGLKDADVSRFFDCLQELPPSDPRPLDEEDWLAIFPPAVEVVAKLAASAEFQESQKAHRDRMRDRRPWY
ncbi:MAG: hypothetical protein OYH76_06475 [Defluviicoccus sp.]|nr:hypothetical protein [Defluviicoccus sp.]MDE0275522.1 hypothetical protein [Defluviicoccus sp.]